MAAFHRTIAITASGVETAAVHPATSENAAAVLMATRTILDRPQRCALSLPLMETRTPASPANVNSTVGSGSQAGEPCQAITTAKKVTAQPLTTAISQVWTVYPAIHANAGRFRNTGR